MDFFKSWRRVLEPVKKKTFLLFCLLLASALIETLSIGSILPLMSAVLGRDKASETIINIAYFNDLAPDTKFIMLVVFVIVIFFLRVIITLMKDYFSADLANSLRRMWSREIFKNFVYGNFSDIRSEKQGHVINSMVNEPIFASKGVHAFISSVVSVLIAIAICILLATINFWITTFALCFVILSILIFWKLSSQYSSDIGFQRVSYNQKINHLIADSANGIRQVKIFSIERRIVFEIDMLVHNLMKILTRFAVFSAAPKAVGEFLVVLLIMSALFIGRFVNDSEVSELIPEITVFSIALMKLFAVGSLFLSKRMELKTYWPSIELIQSRMQKYKNTNAIENVKVPKLQKSIFFENVSFGYEKSTDVLSGVNIELPKGNIIGLVGESGSGKSSVCDLLSRLLEPTNGQILVDKSPLSSIEQSAWLQNIGYVSQDAFLFNDTVSENIKLGAENASPLDVVNAARAANAHDFIMDLPNEYDTIIGRSGLSLSGGQKQRIALAQALIRTPDILILDEFTSALDVVNEKKIMMNLKKYFNNCLIVIVTHRMSSLMLTDHIYLLQNGIIAESGSYKELSSTKSMLNELMQS